METIRRERGAWEGIIRHAADIVNSYDTGVTLRQLFYRLVSEGILKNTLVEYKQLSARTAEARRQGWFPALFDRTRTIHRYGYFGSPKEAIEYTVECYRRDRTENQEYSIYLGIEKHGLVEMVQGWFGDLGLPVIALGGYSSQTYVDAVVSDVEKDGRPAILLYVGDFDASGEDITRDFEGRSNCFDILERVALSIEQVEEFNLPPMVGKATDPRAAAFVAKYGKLIQVEVDAIPPDTLRELYEGAIARYFDMSIYKKVVAREKRDRKKLSKISI